MSLPFHSTPSGAPASEALFSVVIDGDQGGRSRRLPALYFGPSQVFADRSEDKLASRLVAMVNAVAAAPGQPTYLVNACRFGQRDGLYIRDLFNRAAYRRKLSRQGMLFADDPFVRLEANGTFRNLDWGSITPSFVVIGPPDEEQEGAVRTSGAMLTFLLAEHRLGPLSAPELTVLTRVLEDAVGLAADNPGAITTALIEVDA